MNAVGHWFRLDWRGRWRSLLVLALLIAFASGTVMTAVAGARRGASALERLREGTLPATVGVLPNEAGFDWDAVRALPSVEAVSAFVVIEFEVDDAPGVVMGFPPTSDDDMRTIERPVIFEGRLADPTRADEVVVTPEFVENIGKGVGDAVTIRLYTPESIDAFYTGTGEFTTEGAPVIEATIVGVIRSPWYSDRLGSPGGIAVSPGLYAKYKDNLVGASGTNYINAFVRLKGGDAAIGLFKAELAEATGRTDIDVWNQTDEYRHLADVTRFEANALLAFALAAGIAALFLVGQSISRYASAVLNDLQVLRSFGMTSAQLRWGAALGPALAAAIGVAVGGVGAVLASRAFPIGSAELVEPSPGLDVDIAVLGMGVLVVPALVTSGALAAAALGLRSLRANAPQSPSRIATAAARAGLPVPALVGVRFALEPGRGHRAVPVRAALTGAMVGVLGVLAAFTFATGVDDAASNPRRFGLFPLQIFFGFNGDDYMPAEEVLDVVAADDDVAVVNDGRVSIAERGDRTVTVFSLDPVGGQPAVVVTEGRLPTGDGEISLGPSTAKVLGAEVGDSIRLAGTRDEQEFQVTGLAFVAQSPHNDYATGSWVTPGGYDGLFDSYRFHIADISLRPGADPDAVAARLTDSLSSALGEEVPDGAIAPPAVPTQLAELRQVRRLPVLLAGFLAILALGAVGHALASAVRRRRHDVAVLRAIGLTRWQSRWIVISQAVVLTLAGLAVGIPLGVVLGRTLWRSVAESTPVAYEAPIAALALLLVVPIALLAAHALAAWPSHRAASMRVGQVLRTE